MMIVSWDLRHKLYAQRAADALPLIRFQPMYNSFQAVESDVELQLAAINFSYGGITDQNKPESEDPISPVEVRMQIHFEIAKYWWTSQHTSAPQHTPNAQDARRTPVTQYISAAQFMPNAQATHSLLVNQPRPNFRFMSTTEATQPAWFAQPLPTVQSTPTAQASHPTSRITGPVTDHANPWHSVHHMPDHSATTTPNSFAHGGEESYSTSALIDWSIMESRSDAPAALLPVVETRREAFARDFDTMFDNSSHENYSNLSYNRLENVASQTDSSVDKNNNNNNNDSG